MRLELAERLRCTRAHSPMPLVVVADEVWERELRRGVAGCPACGFEVRINGGRLEHEAVDQGAPSGPAPAEPAIDRIQALLALADPDGVVLLSGSYGDFAAALEERCGVSVVRLAPTAPAIPFTDGTFRAAALDGALRPGLVVDVVRCLALGGRLVGRASVGAPGGVRLLARDDAEWVAERDASGPIVPLGRRR